MFCKHCGKQIEDDSNFCSFCGGKVAPLDHQNAITQPHVQSEIKSTSINLPEFIYFRKLISPMGSATQGKREEWLSKKVDSGDSVLIESLEKDDWNRYDPEEKNCKCCSCEEFFGFDDVSWLQDNWWKPNYRKGFSPDSYNYYCGQCTMSIRMTEGEDDFTRSFDTKLS